jgi:threonine dehydratase
LQYAGAFKTRGAFVNLLARDVPRVGVVAASGGNHGAAVAYAAMRLGVPAKIFVPTIASPAKIERIRGYGADLVVGGERYADALAASEAWVAETGALVVPAFDQRETLLGQGTVGLELEAQVPDLDTLLVPVGGGGLIGGIAAWYRGQVRVVGSSRRQRQRSPKRWRQAARSMPKPEELPRIRWRPSGLARWCFRSRSGLFVDSVVLVSDEAIRAAQQALWEALRIVAEPGCAASLAALLLGRYQPRHGERVGVLLSGGNTNAVDFAR